MTDNSNNIEKNKSRVNPVEKYKILIIIIGMIIICITGLFLITSELNKSIDKMLNPLEQTSKQIKTQVSEIIHPTPTIVVDPVTILREIRNLARLETIQYSVEKVITAESGEDEFGFLFGDRLLFVAHGTVIAGIDLNKPININIEGDVVYLKLPEPEIFIATLDNEKSYVYDRKVGILTKGDPNLETSARRAAEAEILNAALEDGILELAQSNAENYVMTILRGMGYNKIILDSEIMQVEE